MSEPIPKPGPPPLADEKIVIVGAGLVGSLLAIFLARRGYPVEIYERHPDQRRVEFGEHRSSINLTLSDRAFRALDRVGKKLSDAVRDATVLTYGRLIHELPDRLRYQPYGRDRDLPTYTILRDDLNAILLTTAEKEFGVRSHFREKCLDIDLETAAVTFQNTGSGESHQVAATRVFGADGLSSAVRQRLQKVKPFNFSQEYLDHGYIELNVPASAECEWIQRTDAVHLWPRGHYMLLGLPNLDGSFVISLHLPLTGEKSFATLRDKSELLDFFAESFPDVVDLIPGLVDSYTNNTVNYFGTVRCFPWTHGQRVGLIGDSAHAIFPFFAQGTNAGFEDCVTLDECLDRHAPDWARVLRAYETERKPNADAISEMAKNHYLEIRNHVGQPDYHLRKIIEEKLHELDPKRYVPLYSLVTFDTIPYVDAMARGQELDALVGRLMAIENIEQRLEGELLSLLENLGPT